jgi:cytochrome c oxidase assembly protein subunit 15
MARFRRAVTATAVLVYLTVLLGVSTKAAGAGLACAARWPLCDGGFRRDAQ